MALQSLKGGVVALAALFSLSGCAAALLPAAATIGTIGGGLTIANQALQLTGNALTVAAQAACVVQAVANAKVPPDAELSRAAGELCKW